MPSELPIDPELGPDSARRLQPTVLAAIALGGAFGAPARYGVAQLIHSSAYGFPWATFVTNVSGSFALGLVVALVFDRFPPTRYLRPFVVTGFLGSYTTYSTFAVETDLLFKKGHVANALTYAVASVLMGVLAVWVGFRLARLCLHPATP